MQLLLLFLGPALCLQITTTPYQLPRQLNEASVDAIFGSFSIDSLTIRAIHGLLLYGLYDFTGHYWRTEAPERAAALAVLFKYPELHGTLLAPGKLRYNPSIAQHLTSNYTENLLADIVVPGAPLTVLIAQIPRMESLNWLDKLISRLQSKEEVKTLMYVMKDSMLPEMLAILLDNFHDELCIMEDYVRGDAIRAAIAMTITRRVENIPCNRKYMDEILAEINFPTSPLELFDYLYHLSTVRADFPFYGLLATLLSESHDPDRLYMLLSVGRVYLTPLCMRMLSHKYGKVPKLLPWFPSSVPLSLQSRHEQYLRTGVLRPYQYRQKVTPERVFDVLVHGGHLGVLPLNWQFDHSIVHRWRWAQVVAVVSYWPYLLVEDRRMDLDWLFDDTEINWSMFIMRIKRIAGPQAAADVKTVLNNLRIFEYFTLMEVHSLTNVELIEGLSRR